MSFPNKIPFWATDAAQAAPPFNPTKVEPPQALKDEGWIPDLRPPAEYHNWWMNKVADWLFNLAPLQLATLLQIDSQRGIWGAAATPNDLYDDGEYYYACGPLGASGGTRRSIDGMHIWSAPTTPAGAQAQEVVISDGAGSGGGTVVTAGAGGEIVRSTDSGNNYAIAEAAGSITSENFLGGVWDPISALFILVTSAAGDGEIWTSPDGAAANWTQRTSPAGMSDARRGAHDGAGTIVFASGDGIIYSTNGTTWTRVGNLSGSNDEIFSAGYSAGDGGYFLAVSENGDVFRSGDGVTWGAAIATDALGNTDAFINDLQSDNGAGWLANISLASGQDTYAYSADGGLTWVIAPYDISGSGGLVSSIQYSARHGRWLIGAGGNNGQVWNTPSILPV
jgi:hypothetical protein